MSKFLSLLIAGMMLFALPAQAAESPWSSADQVRARLLADDKGMGALEIDIAEGWHSYWRSPGDAGLAPTFDWNASTNLESIDLSWPYPKRFESMGLVTFGYEGRQILPFKVKPVTEGEPVKLALALEIMVCKDICIPQQLDLSLDMATGASRNAALIESAARAIPAADKIPALAIETVVTGPDAIVVSAFSEGGFDSADIFSFAGDRSFTAAPHIKPDAKDGRKALITIKKPEDIEDFKSFLAGKELTIVLVSRNRAVEKIIAF